MSEQIKPENVYSTTTLVELATMPSAEILKRVRLYPALLEAAKIGLRIADHFIEPGGTMTKEFWEDRDRMVEVIARAER